MMIRAIIVSTLTICLFACIGSTGLNADWQYTRWGMSLADAIKASNGQLQPCNPEACSTKTNYTLLRTAASGAGAVGHYESGDLKFKAFLSFDKAGKLAAVHLVLDNAEQASNLVDALERKYGLAASKSTTLISESREWLTSDDLISTMVLLYPDRITPSDAWLRYLPRASSNNEGL